MDVQNRVVELMMEIEYFERTMDILEVGFEYCGYGDTKSIIASIHVINKYFKMIREELIEKIAETFLSDT